MHNTLYLDIFQTPAITMATHSWTTFWCRSREYLVKYRKKKKHLLSSLIQIYS